MLNVFMKHELHKNWESETGGDGTTGDTGMGISARLSLGTGKKKVERVLAVPIKTQRGGVKVGKG